MTAISVAWPPSAVMLCAHVGGAANPVRLVIERDDRDRRLGRDTRHAADDEACRASRRR